MSGQFNVEPDLYADFMNRSETNVNSRLETSPVPEPERIVYQDKSNLSGLENTETIDAAFSEKVLRRSQSEKMKVVCSEKKGRKLRRSETERCQKLVRSGDKISPEVVDELSNEEFQRTIEAFIAKQVKFHHEEKFAIVAPNEGFTNCHI